MTKAHSETDDNAGRCESCNELDTVFMRQSTVSLRLGGGLGRGTMWVCDACRVFVLRLSFLRELLERIMRWRR